MSTILPETTVKHVKGLPIKTGPKSNVYKNYLDAGHEVKTIRFKIHGSYPINIKRCESIFIHLLNRSLNENVASNYDPKLYSIKIGG